MQVPDIKTDSVIWELKFYSINYNKGLEKDVQDIFVTKMEIQDQKLVIWNEKNDRFVVNVKTREVIPQYKIYDSSS